jgi:hypothetical protein
MSTVRIYFFQNPPVELYQKIFITTYEPLRTTVLLLTLRNLSRNLALAHGARARLLERLLDYSIRPCTYYT